MKQACLPVKDRILTACANPMNSIDLFISRKGEKYKLLIYFAEFPAIRLRARNVPKTATPAPTTKPSPIGGLADSLCPMCSLHGNPKPILKAADRFHHAQIHFSGRRTHDQGGHSRAALRLQPFGSCHALQLGLRRHRPQVQGS